MRSDTIGFDSTYGLRSRAVRLALAGALLVALAQTGCAFSESSGSISNSVGSISDSFGSSSDSSTSSSGDEQSAYRRDVRDYTVAAAEAGTAAPALRRGVSEIALERGLSDWEAVGATWSAIAEGLGAADISDAARQRYREALAPGGRLGDRAIRARLDPSAY